MNNYNTNELTHHTYDELERFIKDWLNSEKSDAESTEDFGFSLYGFDIKLYPIIPFSKYPAVKLKEYSEVAAEKIMLGFLGVNFYTPEDQTFEHTELSF